MRHACNTRQDGREDVDRHAQDAPIDVRHALGRLIVDLRKKRIGDAQYHALDEAARKRRELLAASVEPEVGRRIELADDERAQVAVDRVDERRAEDLRPEAEHLAEGLPGEREQGTPPREAPDDRRAEDGRHEAGPDEGPDAEAPAGHEDAGDAGEDRHGEVDERHRLEVERDVEARALDRAERADDEAERRDPRDRRQDRHPEELRDPRRGDEQADVEEDRRAEVEVEERRVVEVRAVLLAHERRAHARVDEGAANGVDEREHRHDAVVRRHQEPREDDPDGEAHELHHGLLERSPCHSLGGLCLKRVRHHFFKYSV